MRFAAAALMAGLIFLLGAVSGFGGSPPSPGDFPEAIRLSGIGIQAPAELPTTIPDTTTLPAAAGNKVAAVAVGHNVVPVPLVPAAAPTVRQQPNTRTSGPTSSPAPSTEPVPAPGLTLTPALPILTTTLSPVPPIPTPTPIPSPTPTPSPTATPTPTPKPSPTPTPTPTPSPPSARRGLLRSFLGFD
jgi:type VI secretion system secreted protein VgrG